MSRNIGCTVTDPSECERLLLWRISISPESLSEFIRFAVVKHVGPEKRTIGKALWYSACEKSEPVPKLCDQVHYSRIDGTRQVIEDLFQVVQHSSR